MNKHKKNLLEGDVPSHLRRLVFPLMWGMFVTEVFIIVDTLYISRLGTSALASLGFIMPVAMFSMGIIFGISVGSTSVLSRICGEGDFDKVRRLATDSLILNTFLVSITAVVGYFLIDPVFRLMGAEGEMLQMIHDYMAVWYCGMVPLSIMVVGNSCIRSTGDTRIPSVIMTLMAVTNICLEPFLIFGWGVFPEMGFHGAALSQVISYTLTSAVLLCYMIFRKGILMPVLFHSGSVESWKRILHVGFPAIIIKLLVPLAAVVVTWMAANLNNEAVAALGISMRIESISIMIFYAMGASVVIFTGQNFGAGNYGRVSEVRYLAAKYVQIWSLIMAVFLWIFSEKIPLFFDSDPLVVSYVTQYLCIVPISYGAFGLLLIYNAALIGMGKPLPAAFFVLLRAFILYVPMAWIVGKYYGFAGILLSLALSNIIVGSASYLWNKNKAV